MKKLLFSTSLIGCLLLSCSDEDLSRKGLEDPLFQNVSSDWFSPYFELEMEEIWKFNGIDRSGMNYFFLPKPNNFSCSDRFIPTSKYFQSWVGIYTVNDNESGVYAIQSGELNPEAIIALAIADQKAWLTSFGLPNPNVIIDESVAITSQSISIDGKKGWKINGGLISNIDVGEGNSGTGFFLTEIEQAFWDEEVSSYQQVRLDVTAYIWHTPENSELNVAYYNTVEFQNLNGETISNKVIQPDLEEMVLSVTVFEP